MGISAVHARCQLEPGRTETPGKSKRDRAEDIEQQEAQQRARLLKALQSSPDGDTATGLSDHGRVEHRKLREGILTLLQEGPRERCRVKKHTRRKMVTNPPASDARNCPELVGIVPAVLAGDAGGQTAYVVGVLHHQQHHRHPRWSEQKKTHEHTPGLSLHRPM